MSDPATAGRRILLALTDPDADARIRPILKRARARTERVDDFASFELAAARPFDLVVSQYPLAGAAAPELLAGLERASSGAAGAPILVTEQARLAELEDLLGELRERPVIATSQTRVLRAIAHALGMNNRAFVRLMVRCELEVGPARVERVWQTHDVSASGMLLRTDRSLPVGVAFPFSLELPEDKRPIAGRGEIVRHARAEKEGGAGIGVRFLSLGGDGADRLERFVDASLATGAGTAPV